MLKLSDIPKHTQQFWYVLGETLCNEIRKRVQKGHMNVDGVGFDDYSEEYATKKGSGEAIYKGGSQASTSTNPDMTLSGKTMANLKTKTATTKHVIFGWLGLHGGIVDSLYGHKNYQIVELERGDPFAKGEMDIIHEHAVKDFNKNIEKYCRTPIIMKVGS